MSESVYAGLTSQTIDVFLADSSSTTGGGLTGLVYNTSGLTCYYRKGATGTATSISLATQSVGGAWSSGGFVEIDSTNMPGVYRLDVPNAVVDTEGFVTIYIQGASNLVPTALRIDCRPIPSDLKKIQGDSTSATDFKSLVDTDFEARTIPSGEYFNWSEDADFSTLESYIDGRTLPSGDYYNPSEDSVNLGSILGTSLTESNGGDLANNVSQFYDVNPTTTNTVDDVGGGSSLTESGIADAVWYKDVSGYSDYVSAGGTLNLAANVVARGTVLTSGLNVVQSDLSTSVNNYYNDEIFKFTSGALAGQAKIITSYIGSTKMFYFDENFTDYAASGDEFVVYGIHNHTKTQIAYELWHTNIASTNSNPSSYGYQLGNVVPDIPTNSEFEARTIPSGDYVQAGDQMALIDDAITASKYDEATAFPLSSVDSGATQIARVGADGDTLETLSDQLDTVTTNIGNLNNFDPTTDTVAHVTLVDTTTTNTDMRGTDNAALAASLPTNFSDLAITASTGRVTVGTNNDKTGYSIAGTLTTLDSFNTSLTVYGDANWATATGFSTFDASSDTVNIGAILGTSLTETSAGNLADNISQFYDLDVTTTNTVDDVGGSGGDATQAKQDTIIAALGVVDNNVDTILTDTGTTIPALISALENISSNDVKAAVAAIIVESQGSYTLQQALSVILSVLAGQSTDNGLTFQTPDGNATRVAATVDANKNRTNMTITPSS